MIAIQTENAFGVTGVTSRAATSPLSGRSRVAVALLSTGRELCPQALRVSGALSVAVAPAAAPMGLRADARRDWATADLFAADAIAPTAIAPTTHLGFDKQYGNTPHHSGTRVRKPPV